MGKPEVVLDAGARARLAAGSAALQHHHVEPFRCGIDGRGEPGGPRAHHDEVVHVPVVELAVEAEHGRHLRIARIAQRPVPVRHISTGMSPRPIWKCSSSASTLRVALDVEVDVRMSVAPRKALRRRVSAEWSDPISTAPPRSLAIRCARRSAKARRNSSLSSVSVCTMCRRSARSISSSSRRVQRARADQALPPGDHVHLPGELAGLVDGEPLLPDAGRARDLDASFQQHVERALGRAALVDHLARREPAPPPDREQARDLRRGEPREHRVQPLGRIRHDVRG